VADTVTDTVVAAISDTTGKAVPAGVAGQPPEPYVPGSGDRVPAKLRLVLAGYACIACLSAGGMALALAVVALSFGLDSDASEAVFMGLVLCSAVPGVALMTRSGFSRLLRRPSDPRAATVTASKHGGRTLILDIIPRDGTGRGYQSLSEVPLALWLKADMLVPGETVNVYGGSGQWRELLISSPRLGRAFLGAITSQSALQPRLLDEKVSGVTLVDWAAWAASTTFSSTYEGYETREVDAFRSAVRDTFLGVIEPAVRSRDLRGKQFSTHRPGYDKPQVEAFVEAAGLRLAAMESTDRPAGALVSGDILFGWVEWVESTTFTLPKPSWRRRGFKSVEVDAFQEAIRDTFLGASKPPFFRLLVSEEMPPPDPANPPRRVRARNVRGKQFSSTRLGYDKNQVAAFLDAAGIRLAAMESTYRPERPLVSGAVLAEWAEWADSTRFSTTPRLWKGYATAEVDAFRKELRDTFLAVSLGVRQPPLTWDDVLRKWPGSGTPWFSATRGWSRPGYDMQEVDAFLKMAKLRLAAI
jgi:DivIVA domain-containing protein